MIIPERRKIKEISKIRKTENIMKAFISLSSKPEYWKRSVLIQSLKKNMKREEKYANKEIERKVASTKMTWVKLEEE